MFIGKILHCVKINEWLEMFCRGWLTGLISVSSTSCITSAWLLLAEVTVMEEVMRDINLLCPTFLRTQNLAAVPLFHLIWVTPCIPSYSGGWRKMYRALWNYSWDHPHSCGEMMMQVIMGRFPHSSLLLCVWVLSAGKAKNDYLLDLILLHHPLEQQSSPLPAAHEQVCFKMSILEVHGANTLD